MKYDRMAVCLLAVFLLAGMSLDTALGGALEVDGAGRVRIAAGTITAVNQLPLGSDPFTVEAWIDPDVHADNSITAWGTRWAANQNNGYRLLGGGKMRQFFWANDLDRTSGDLSADGWHHVAISWDGVSSRQMYLDGAPLGAAHSSAVPNVTLDANGLIIGSAQDNTEGFNGLIDEVRVWDTARTGAEIADNYKTAMQGSEAGLVGYWNFDGHVQDQSQTGHNGSREGDAVIRLDAQAPVAAANSLLPDGMVGFWDFNNAANVGQATAGAHLTPFNGASYSTDGRRQGALSLSGASQYLALQDTAGVEDVNNLPGDLSTGDQSYTLSAWVKLAGADNSNGIVGWGGYGTAGQVNAFRTRGDEHGLVNYGWGSGYDYDQTSTTDVGDGAWHHVAATYDSASSTKRLYVDGAEIGSGATIGGDLNIQARRFRVGSTNSGEYFDGVMDEVAIWNKALDSAHIESIGKGASPLHAPLVSLWRFEDAGNLGADSSALGNTLTRQGNAAQAAGGRFGGALSLDGSGDFLSAAAFPDGLPVDNTDYTIAAWILPEETGIRAIAGWGNFGTALEVNTLRLNGDNGFSHYWWGNDLNASDAQVAALGVDLDGGAWHHVAATFDGTTRSIWLDGELLVSDTPGSAHNVGAANFRIGASLASGNGFEYFKGLLDDVAIFNAALTQDQIRTIMGSDFTGFGIAPVPEPSTLALLLLGSLGLIGLARRRRG